MGGKTKGVLRGSVGIVVGIVTINQCLADLLRWRANWDQGIGDMEGDDDMADARVPIADAYLEVLLLLCHPMISSLFSVLTVALFNMGNRSFSK